MDGFGLQPLAGGHSGETFLAEAAGERTVVRIYGERSAGRGSEAPLVDASVLHLVRGLVPVPDVLEVRGPDPASGAPGLLVTTFLPGTRLDLLLPDLDADARSRVGHGIGVLLARLAQMPMPRAGRFVDDTLRTEPFPGGDLVDFVESHRRNSALADWPDDAYDALRAVAEDVEARLEATRTSLVHGDLNPKNLLVDPETLGVTAVLDWEFAHAGSPFTDLGNLLRFERDPAYAGAVLDAYRELVVDAPDDALDRARAADLFALVDLAGRRGENPVTEQAHDLLREIARSRDLHATP